VLDAGVLEAGSAHPGRAVGEAGGGVLDAAVATVEAKIIPE